MDVLSKLLEPALAFVQAHLPPEAMLVVLLAVAGLWIWGQWQRSRIQQAEIDAVKARAAHAEARLPGGAQHRPDRRRCDRTASSRVLLVEDNDVQALIVRELLDLSLSSVEVRRKASAGAAIRELPTFQPELVVLDLTLLGEETGVEVLQHLRRRGQAVPVLVYSGSVEQIERVRQESWGVKVRIIDRNAPDAQHEFLQTVPTMFSRRSSDRVGVVSQERRDRRCARADRRAARPQAWPPGVQQDRRGGRAGRPAMT